jgi:hypothetical protein
MYHRKNKGMGKSGAGCMISMGFQAVDVAADS